MSALNAKCEVCGKQATVCVNDVRECTQQMAGITYRHAHPTSNHFFCEEHQRGPVMEQAAK